MKRYLLPVAALGALVTLSADGAQSSESPAATPAKTQVPQTAAAKASADLLARADHAFRGYAAACAAGNSSSLRQVVMRDLHLEYAADEPNAASHFEEHSLSALCATLGGKNAQISNLWIFPTNDATSVFVQYDLVVAGMTPQQQLALVEMQGERISRMVNFAGPPSVLTANAGGVPKQADTRVKSR